MSVDMAAVIITAVGVFGTAINLYLTINIRSSILEMKVWSNEKFVAKEDMKYFVEPYMREVKQLHESALRHVRHG